MRLGLINSARAEAGRDAAFGIRMTKTIGLDPIDLVADPLGDRARAAYDSTARLMTATGRRS